MKLLSRRHSAFFFRPVHAFFAAILVLLAGGSDAAYAASTKPTITSVTRTPSPMKAGQGYTVTWVTTNATSMAYSCTANGTGFTGSATGLAANGNTSGTASSAWVGYPSSCTWTATSSSGATAKYSETMTTTSTVGASMPSPADKSTYYAPMNGSAAVPVSGSATTTNGSISKIEVLVNGATSTSINTSSINTSLSLAAGSYTVQLRATDSTGTVAMGPQANITVLTSVPTITVARTPSPMLAGQSYTVNWTTTDATSVAYSCTANGTGFTGSATGLVATSNSSGTASAAWVGYPSTCTWTATGPGGSGTAQETMTTNSVVNVTMTTPSSAVAYSAQVGTSAAVSVAGNATTTNGTISKWEALDNGSVVATYSGANNINTTVPLAIGSHSLQLQATDVQGSIAKSNAVSVTVNTAPPTITVTRNPNPMVATQQYAVSWTTTGATSVDYRCLDRLALSSYDTASGLAPNDSKSGTVPLAWYRGDSYALTQCIWTAHGVGGNTSYTEAVSVVLPPPPTITITRNPTPMVIGQPYTVSWVTNGASSVDYTCRDRLDLTSFADASGLPPNGSSELGSNLSWASAGYPIDHCYWTAHGVGQDTRYTEHVSAVLPAAPTITVTRTPATMIAGQPYTVSWTTTGAISVDYRCMDRNQLTSYGDERGLPPSGSNSGVTGLNWGTGGYALTWCFWTAHGVDQDTGYTEGISINPPSTDNGIVAPSATLTATPTDIHIAASGQAAIGIVGNGTSSSSKLARIELFQDSGSGYAATPVSVVAAPTGAVDSLDMVSTLSLGIGVYRLKLRSTDTAGNATDSEPVWINIADSSLLGTVNGVRIDASGTPQLNGWVCQSGSSEKLVYTLMLNAPTLAAGGVAVSSGSAELSTDPENSNIQAACGTPGAGHHFNIDLNAINSYLTRSTPAPWQGIPLGTPLFVQARTLAGATIILPCSDNNCTMPGSLRIGLTTPNNNDHYAAPATVFMRAKLTNGTGPYDQVAFNINGQWIDAVPDTAADTYYASVSGLPASATPYPVIAKVRQGTSTVYTTENLIYVDAGSGAAITLGNPANGMTANVGDAIPLSATVSGTMAAVQSVKFFVNGAPVGTPTNNGGTWTANWTGSVAGVYNIMAAAFDGNGVQLAASPIVKLTAIDPQSATSATPIPVNVDTPHLGNADAGSLPGGLGVSKDGAATYGIPIAVPPGTVGLAPNLSLNYSSQGTNGLLGLGWSLGGMSSIHRCGKTIAQDGVNDRIKFDHADRLCLDGQRLVLVNLSASDDNYWADGAEYRTEIDSFSRITAQGSGDANRSFKVESKDGRIMYFGNTSVGVYPQTSSTSVVRAIVGPVQSNSTTPVVPPAKSGPLSWAISSILDRAGNYINFSYTQDGTTGEHKPDVIRYGGVGLASHAAVQFTYESRSDAWKKYVDQARNDLRSRITHIKTYVGTNLDGDVAVGAWVRDYTLSYEQSLTSGRSLLDSVRACARNPQTTATECLPATTFAWGKPDPSKIPGFVSRGIWAGAPILTTHGPGNFYLPRPTDANHADYFVFADFENHGVTDVLEKRVASPVPSDMNTIPGIQREAGNPIQPGTRQNSYHYYHNNGNGFTRYTYQLDTGEPFAVIGTGDFDGNGTPDILVSTANNGAKICLSPLGKGALGAADSTIVFTCDPNRPAVGDNTSSGIPYVVDVVGDGRSAHYSQGYPTSTICIQNGPCTSYPYAPATMSIGTFADGVPVHPEFLYTSFQDMVDFAGTGKPNQVFWSQPHFQSYTYQPDGQRITDNTWYNLHPIVQMPAFPVPGVTASAGSMTSYSYPAYMQCPPDDPYSSSGCVKASAAARPYFFEPAASSAGLSGDFNGSGYNGLAFGFLELTRNASTGAVQYGRAETTVCLSTGRELDCGIRQKYSGVPNYHAPRAVGNFVGDGQPSILVETMSYPSTTAPVATGNLQMCRLMGDDATNGTGASDANMVCDPWPGATLPNVYSNATDPVDHVYFMDLLGTGRTQLVYYRTGYLDSSDNWIPIDTWEVFEPIDLARSGQALDRIYQVTNGVGQSSSVEYVDGVTSGIVSQSGTSALSYPQHPSAGTGKIVSKLHVGNGVAGDYTTSYRYQDAAIDVAGRGSLGFGSVTMTDDETGIVSTTSYAQAWPFTGMAIASTVTAGGCTLSNTTSQLADKTIAQANGTITHFPFTGSSSTDRRDLSPNCNDLGNVTTSGIDADGHTPPYVQYDNWGNLLKSQTVASGAGKSFTTQNLNTYLAADTAHWLVGLVQRATVTKSQSTGGTPISRTTDFTYEANYSGRVATQTLQGDDTTLSMKLLTSYDRSGNAFGLVNGKTQIWYDPVAKANASRTDSTTYDANGRFPLTVTNALSQSETRAYEPGTGAQIYLKGPNLLETNWTIDGFGRVTKELRADINETRQYRKQCDGTCPSGAVMATVTDNFHGVDRIAVPQVTYSDSAGHLLRSMTWGFDGRAIVADSRYDSVGRLYETDQPHYSADTAYLAQRQQYDALNRVVAVTAHDEQGTEQTATTQYQGYVVVNTNAKNQKRTDTRDALGRIEQAVDAINGVTAFSYDPFGNLTQTIDPRGNVIKVSYDALGRKTQLLDTDLGQIDYAVDALGRTWQQVNPVERAAGKVTSMSYDKLDRMTDRLERDLQSHWVYDTAAKGVGQLAEAYTGTSAAKDYRRLHTYDTLGRPSTTTQVLFDGSYTSTPAYDAWSRMITQTVQRKTDAAKVFDLRYNGYGYLSQLQRGSLVLWQAQAQDAAQRITQANLGNGLTQTRTYHAQTSRLDSAILLGGNVLRLSESYQYDVLGSVMERGQYWDGIGFVEGFTYDELNRLTTSQVAGQVQQVFNYFADGSIQNKTGVGTGDYVYPAQGAALDASGRSIHPHGVQSITGMTGSFYYDDNGNLTSGAGRTATGTSFDMPVTITKGSNSSSFVYGPEHQRTRQIKKANNATTGTIVYAGAQEIELDASNQMVSVKTYWPNGVGLEIDKPGQATALNWVHNDRLGSVVAITDNQGNVTEQLAYDAWGKRRTLDGASVNGTATPDSIDGMTDNKGFTHHEMLDQLDLVHMNGRVYDPLVAKFMSGDPLVGDPMNGQNYNRYSYVLNNPTNLTDPTGFTPDCPGGSGDRCAQEQKANQSGAEKINAECGQSCIAGGKLLVSDGKGGYAVYAMSSSSSGGGTQTDANGNIQPKGKTGGAANNTHRPESSENYSPSGQGFFTPHSDPNAYPGSEIVQVVVTAKKLVKDVWNRVAGDDADKAAATASLKANGPQYIGLILMARGNARSALSKLPRFEGPKPTYHVNQAHVPGPRYNPQKTPLPSDAEEVFETAVPNDPVKPTAWFGKNSEGQIYRYSSSNDGTAHFSGIDGVGDGVRNLTPYAVDRLNGK
jgi:RHS repeat-associated protein